MSGPLTEERPARRLARAIVADILLYNEDALRAGSDLSENVAEGRKLFESRTLPEFHKVFDEAVTELLVPRVKQRRASEGAASQGAGPEQAASSSASPSSDESAQSKFASFYAEDTNARPESGAQTTAAAGRPNMIIFVLAILVAVGVAAAYFAVAR